MKYFPAVHKDTGYNIVPVMSIGESKDVLNSVFNCSDNPVRVVALIDSRLFYRKSSEQKKGDGMFMPAGSSVDVATYTGYVLEVAGSVNITKYI